MRTVTTWVALAILLGGCNPYMAAVSAVSATYGVATDVRSVATQASDTQIEAQIKAALVTDPVAGTGSLAVYCRLGVVLIAGVVPPGSTAGREAVRVARETAGVRRIETFFVPAQPAPLQDLAIKEKIKATLVADPNVVEGRVDVAVYGGHVVLVGVLTSWSKVDEFVDDARSVNGVVSVRSYIQVA
jgi:osmotically-inducible protein OsmY